MTASSVVARPGAVPPVALVPPLAPGGVTLAVVSHLAVALAVGAVVRSRARRHYHDPEDDAATAVRLRRWGLLGGWLATAVVTVALETPTVATAAVDAVVPGAVTGVVGPLLAVLLPAVPAALAGARVVRATERSADAYAAATVGGPALAGALERLAERRYVVQGDGPLGLISYHPPLAERIAHLRGEWSEPSVRG